MSPSFADHDLRPVIPDGPLVDFDPSRNEPDREVWPRPPFPPEKPTCSLSEGLVFPFRDDDDDSDWPPSHNTPGTSDDDELVPIYGYFPAPNVRWLTPGQFESEFGYPPDDPGAVVRDEVLNEVHDTDHLTLGVSRREALTRLGNLWNGETVGPHDSHLLADKAPLWDELFGDLPQIRLDVLRPTVYRQPDALVDAFGDFSWFDPQTTRRGWLKTVHIARSRADYAPEHRTRVLLNEQEEFPTLNGDPFEGLVHRFGVGLEALRAEHEGGTQSSYHHLTGADGQEYIVDLYESNPNREEDCIVEVLTGHHNYDLHRETITKLMDIGLPTRLVFDTWETARTVFNVWHEFGVDVPGAPFGSSLNVGWVRSKFQEAAADPTSDWLIEDVVSLSTLWNELFDSEDTPSRQDIISVNW